MVKIKFSDIRCHEEIAILLTNQSRHLYSVSLASLHEQVVLCRSCADAFMIMADDKKICFHFKAESTIDGKVKVICCVKCLRIAISRHFYILPYIVM